MQHYDVFLSYRRRDETAVAKVAADLRAAGLRVFFDLWELVPGEAWQEGLERALDGSAACAVFIGPDGIGPWQNEEFRTAIEDRVRMQDFRVIPVFLPGADASPDGLPRFIRRYTACTLNSSEDAVGMHRLMAGIRAEAPGPGVVSAPGVGRTPSLRRQLGIEASTWRRDCIVDAALRAYRNVRLPIVLHGLGGMGKTVVACDLAEAIGGGRDVIPVPAAPAKAIDASWVLDRLPANPGSALARGPLNRLIIDRLTSILDKDVVLVLDGLCLAPGGWAVDAMQAIGEDARAIVIVTADRRPDLALPLHAIPVPPLAAAESLAFIEHHKALLSLAIEPAALMRDARAAVLSHPRALRALLASAKNVPGALLGLAAGRSGPPDLTAGLLADLGAMEARILILADLVAGADVRDLLAFRLLTLDEVVERLPRLVDRCLVALVADSIEVPAVVSEVLASTMHDVRAEVLSGALGTLLRAASDPSCSGDVLAALHAAMAARAASRSDWPTVSALCSEQVLERVNVNGRWKEYLLLLRLRVEAADAAGGPDERIDYRLRLIRKLAQSRDFALAWQVLHEVGEQIEQFSPHRRAEHLTQRGFLNHLENNADAAWSDLNAARELHEAAGHSAGLMVVDKLLGHFHLRRHDHAAAAASYREALRLAEQTGVERQRMEIESSLAVCELHVEGPAPAESRLLRVIAAMSKGEQRPELARALLNLSVVLESQNRFAEARETALRGARLPIPDASLTYVLQSMADRLGCRSPVTQAEATEER